jgi:hypothetical protein
MAEGRSAQAEYGSNDDTDYEGEEVERETTLH